MAHHDTAWTYVGLVVLLAGIALLGWYIREQARAGLWRRDHRPPLWDVSRERRRALRGQVIASRPESERDLPELRAMAGLMVAGGRSLLLPASLILMQIGGALSDQARWHWVFAVAFTVVMGAAAAFVARRAGQGARFLERFPGPGVS